MFRDPPRFNTIQQLGEIIYGITDKKKINPIESELQKCIGNLAELHTKLQKNSNFHRFENELIVNSNGPTLSKGKQFIEKYIDRHFGSRKNWNCKNG